jgi:hypothetical protein
LQIPQRLAKRPWFCAGSVGLRVETALGWQFSRVVGP